MALENRQPYIQQPVLPQHPEQQREQQQTTKPTKKRAYVSMQEKVLYVLFVGVVTLFAISILNKQADLQQMTIEVQNMEAQVEEVVRQNVDLKVQVSELSKYERIWEKAQALGLTLNENNVKVVPGQ